MRFGHIWTNITEGDLKSLKLSYGDILTVELMYKDRELFRGVIPFCKTFYDVNPGDKLVYINSMMNVALGIHQESFADLYGIKAGPEYKIRITGA